MNKKISITMVNYNGKEITAGAIESIYNHGGIGREFIEIILVDNNSNDDSVECIGKIYPDVKILINDENKGFARAQNQAILMSEAEYVLVMNNDIIIKDNALKEMIEMMNKRKEVGILGVGVRNADNTLSVNTRKIEKYNKTKVALSIINQYYKYDRYIDVKSIQKISGAMKPLKLGRLHDKFEPILDTEEVEWIDGMCFLVRRKAFEDVGLFDEIYYFDCEIGDFLLRARKAGWKILFVPKIEIIHLGANTRNKNRWIMKESKRSELIFYAKNRVEYYKMVRAVNIISINTRKVYLKVLRKLGIGSDPQKELDEMDEMDRVIKEFDWQKEKMKIHIPTI